MQWIRVGVVLMHGLLAGCGPTEEPDLDPVDGGTSGPGSTGPVGVTDSDAEGESSSSGGVSSTTADTDPELDTDADTDAFTDTDGDPSQPCTSTACTTTCVRPVELENASGEVCECDRADTPDDYRRCDLGDPCAGDRLCVVQAVRYGVVGTYRLEQAMGDDHFRLVIDVLGEGRARAYASGWTHDCCDGTDVNEYGTFHHPQAVVDPEHVMWRECIRAGAPKFEQIPECLLPENMLAGSCEEPLDECPPLPEPPDPDAKCDETCPMTEDDVCDEIVGTGLCGEGCDRIDCNCTADVPSECDADYGDPTCPLASDPDCG